MEHRAWVEGIGVEAQDTLRDARFFVFVGADAGLAGHVLAGEHQTGAADHSPLQHVVCFAARGVYLGCVTPPQSAPQDVLHRHSGKGDRAFEDVYSQARVEVPHLHQGLEKGRHVQIVVVLQPVSKSLHASLLKHALATLVLRGE